MYADHNRQSNGYPSLTPPYFFFLWGGGGFEIPVDRAIGEKGGSDFLFKKDVKNIISVMEILSGTLLWIKRR